MKKDKETAFDKFVKEVEAKFTGLEDLIKSKPPKAGKETKDEGFKLLQENYDKRFDDFSTELTSLKELFTGVKEKVDKARQSENGSFWGAFLGF